MAYIDVITLPVAKTHLRVSHTDSDTEITRMINSALNMIEVRTNVLVYDRDITYAFYNSCVRVHGGPINTVGVTGLETTVTREDYSDYSLFWDTNVDNLSVELNVGYDDPANVPTPIIEAALEMIDYWYYKKEGAEKIGLYPPSVTAILEAQDRFIL